MVRVGRIRACPLCGKVVAYATRMTFATYWPHYLRHHSNRTNRTLHFVGWLVLLCAAAVALATQSGPWLVAGIAAAYTLAWIGHFSFQREAPDTFRHPWLANLASLKMFALMATGRLRGHLDAHGVVDTARGHIF